MWRLQSDISNSKNDIRTLTEDKIQFCQKLSVAVEPSATRTDSAVRISRRCVLVDSDDYIQCFSLTRLFFFLMQQTLFCFCLCIK